MRTKILIYGWEKEWGSKSSNMIIQVISDLENDKEQKDGRRECLFKSQNDVVEGEDIERSIGCNCFFWQNYLGHIQTYPSSSS